MFLVFSAILACGMDGIKRGHKLPPPLDVDPSSLDEKTLRAKNIKQLPRTFQERKEALIGSAKAPAPGV
jgi:glutamine synthetase